MIRYHGGPITPTEAACAAWKGRHAFISYSRPDQIELAANMCHSFALDNGAFSAWRSGKAVADWSGYYEWVEKWGPLPNCDFAVIPDVIDGSEEEQDRLLEQWPFGPISGVPVWHMHESIERLVRLCSAFPRVAMGSSGSFVQLGSVKWWGRMREAWNAITNEFGQPLAKLHGLRMMDPEIFSRIPFASVDSTMIARNIGIDGAWRGTYLPPGKASRAHVLAERLDAVFPSLYWEDVPAPQELFVLQEGAANAE